MIHIIFILLKSFIVTPFRSMDECTVILKETTSIRVVFHHRIKVTHNYFVLICSDSDQNHASHQIPSVGVKHSDLYLPFLRFVPHLNVQHISSG